MVNIILASLVVKASLKQLENALSIIDSYNDNEPEIVELRQMIIKKISQLEPK